MALTEYLLPQWGDPLGVALTFTILTVVLCILNSIISVPYPKGVPLLREPPGATRFSLKTRLAYYLDCPSLFQEAYQNYSKKGKAVIIPGLGARAEIILPVSSMRWALSQPDDVVSVGEAFVEIDGAYYAFGTERPITDDWQGKLVKTEMGKVLENLCEAMNHELSVAFDEHFGTDIESWKRIDLLPVVRRVVAQASSRFTVGLPLCRNTEYLNTNLEIIDGLIANAGVTSGSPPLLRPIFGRLSGLPIRLKCRKLRQLLEPIMRERIQVMESGQQQQQQPQDQLQMMVRYAAKERPNELSDFDLLTKRIVAANFGSMHQTSVQVTNMLLNILASDDEFHTIAALRSEVAQIMGGQSAGDSNTGWTKAKVAQMVQADSAARETMRLYSFGGRSVFRKVLPAGGVVTDEGVVLPKGSLFSFLSMPPHMDVETYEDAERYDPFRFSRARASAAGVEGEEEVRSKTSFVTTSADYLPFSHGRHACPGRFLIDFEMKMILAYVLGNYDIKFPDVYGGKRPENRWVTEALFPPDGAAIMVKRKSTGA
ncbi:unnamed protein product [Discula destructiva]